MKRRCDLVWLCALSVLLVLVPVLIDI